MTERQRRWSASWTIWVFYTSPHSLACDDPDDWYEAMAVLLGERAPA